MAHNIRIRNSFGVRIPKRQAREGWEQKFKSSTKRKKRPLLGEFFNDFDLKEWKW